ncbi:MAG: DASH family cryptochrome [Candidatus Sericytochromatia bacterium]|nr:DASH family cryptochrome [Candidatus Sericytochromatia bacterium]
MQNTLIWFRNDLRVHDNETLYKASQQGNVIPVYCFDPRHFEQTPYGFSKTGKFRAKFLLESVIELKKSLQKLGSDLIVRFGEPEKLIPEMVKKENVTHLYYQGHATYEEVNIEDNLTKLLKDINIKKFYNHTLYHLEDLNLRIDDLPDVFTMFRQKIEKNSRIRSTFPIPQSIKSIHQLEEGEIPKLEQLTSEIIEDDERSVLLFKGGENNAIDRLNKYFWDNDQLKNYKETRNGLLGSDFSSKFSAWLANGSISPRKIYEEVKKYEKQVIKNDSTYWLIFELIWRDFFFFYAMKFGDRIFFINGTNQNKNLKHHFRKDPASFEKWKNAQTGIPFIDANMRELAKTGYMSNRGRQNVASFLTKDLKIDWRLGAEYFESILIDYDVSSNWANWNYVAGVGADPREDRYFNIIKQSNNYDGQGKYIKTWLPELNKLPKQFIHQPYLMTKDQQVENNCILGKDYPRPLVSLSYKG